MIAIRGATTIKKDSPGEIAFFSAELFDKMLSENKVDLGDIVCLMISTTSDIKSSYVAKELREKGYIIPLYSSLEPEIKNSLKLCIRFMLLVDSDIEKSKVKHIYLGRAKMLRKDISNINIALDGPAGSGKSTIAKLLSSQLNIQYLDTGAMYRAAALKAVNLGIDTSDEKAVESFISDIDLKIEYVEKKQLVFLDGIDVTDSIRKPEMSMLASNISKHFSVRQKMVELQRQVAEKFSCVLDGRDIGTYVLPNADFKFYLTADSSTRAKRRYDELRAGGYEIVYEDILSDILKRDFNDINRNIAPLKQADDAIIIDTTNMTIEEVIENIKTHIVG